MNPVLVKELRGRMRGWRSLLVISIYLIVMGGITLLTYMATRDTFSGYPGGQSARMGQTLFYVMVIFQMVMVSLLTPAFTSSAITQEREQKTYELLVTTLLPARSIVLGKLGAALAYVGLLIIAVAPFESLAFMFGGVSPEEIVLSQIVVFMSAVFFASAGVFWSAVVRTSVASNVLTYGTMLFQMLGIPFVYLTLTSAFGASPFGSDVSREPWFIYLSLAILSLHPIIAMAFSEALYLQGDPLFIYYSDNTFWGQDLLIISPWLVFCVEMLLISALLVWIAIRKTPPVRYARRRNLGTYAPPERP